jgi:sugar phosphate isomerase/epimerase
MALTGDKTPVELQDADRVLSGEGGLPLADLLTAISGIGYKGTVSVEVFHLKYGDYDSREVTREAYQQARTVLQVAGCPR